jgi:hypothetical protein
VKPQLLAVATNYSEEEENMKALLIALALGCSLLLPGWVGAADERDAGEIKVEITGRLAVASYPNPKVLKVYVVEAAGASLPLVGPRGSSWAESFEIYSELDPKTAKQVSSLECKRVLVRGRLEFRTPPKVAQGGSGVKTPLYPGQHVVVIETIEAAK